MQLAEIYTEDVSRAPTGPFLRVVTDFYLFIWLQCCWSPVLREDWQEIKRRFTLSSGNKPKWRDIKLGRLWVTHLMVWLLSGAQQAPTSMDWCRQEGHFPDLILRPVEHLQLPGGFKRSFKRWGKDSHPQRRTSGWPEAHLKLLALDTGLIGSRKGWRERWEQPGRSGGVWCRSHRERLPHGFAAQWMAASCCTRVWTHNQTLEGISQGHPVQAPPLMSQKPDQRV